MTPAKKRAPIPFGKYLLLDRLSIGGIAEVWRATAPGVGGHTRALALKRILPHVAADPDFSTLFTQEAQLVLRLNHPHIAQHFEVGRIDGGFFIAMEYVAGKDLGRVFDRCRKNGTPAPLGVVCSVLAQSAHALEYAHGLGILHRDVSPQNVLVGYDGDVKVIGWTPSVAFGAGARGPSLRGKFTYLSPEQVRGQRIDHRSEVFQLGICLYELLTGVRLFVADSDFAILEKVRDGVIAPPRDHHAEIPEALEQVVLKALAKDPDARYQSAGELADALQPFSSDRAALLRFMKATFAEDEALERQRTQGPDDPNAPEGPTPPAAAVSEVIAQLERKWGV